MFYYHGITIGLAINNGILNKTLSARDQYIASANEENERLEKIYSQILLVADNEKSTLENVDMTTLKELIRQEGNPTGTIIAFYGETAPSGYLPCDGTTRNTSEYSELANFLGATEDTFNLPDLRGEFLRGTGTNSHLNQGDGETVGTHKDATNILRWSQTDYGHYVTDVIQNEDKRIASNINSWKFITANIGTNTYYGGEEGYGYSSIRPTNTSVLYCIKY